MGKVAKELFATAETLPTNVLVRVLKERFENGNSINGEDYCRDLAATFFEAAEIQATRKRDFAAGSRTTGNLPVYGA